MRINVNGIDEIWSADLIDIQAFSKDNNYKYLLTVITKFSKFVWIVSLKRKTGQEVANAFSWILKERRPSKLWVDKGHEIYNKDVKKLVELYSTENEEKSCVIEKKIYYLRPFVMRSTFNKLKLSAKKAESEAHV